MTAGEALDRIRQRIVDVDKEEFPDAELIQYLNAAIDQKADILVKERNSNMTKRLMVVYGTDVPADFIAWAGEVPAERRGGKFYPAKPGYYLYFARPDQMISLNDSLPWNGLYDHFLIQVASLHAKRRQHYDVGQDAALANAGVGQ
jgi:hypothetical protein